MRNWRVALGYIVCSALAIALVATPLVPLWQPWLVTSENRAVYGIGSALALLILLGATVAWLLARRAAALRRSEERYERVILAAQAGFWDWDVLKDEFVVSPRLLEMAELPPGTTFSGRADFMTRARFHTEGWEKWQQAVTQLFAGGGSRLAMEFRSIQRDGRVMWYRLDGMCTRDAAGKVVRWTGSAVDIVDRKFAEEALRVSQERYALAVAGSDDGVWDVDYSARSVFMSARARELSGMPPGPELVPMDEWFAALAVHPDDVERRAAAMQAHLQGDAPAYVGEFRLLQLDGAYRWRRLRGLCVRDAEGKPQRMAGSISDVDARKRAEDALRLSEERYALALDTAAEGHLDWNALTGEFFASDQAKRVLNVPLGARYSTREEVMGLVPFHPDDLPSVHAWRALLADSDEAQFRILRGEEPRWIWTRRRVYRGAEGNVRRIIGVVADITEQKRAEALLAGEKQLLELMAHATPLPTVLDALCRIVEENLGGCMCSILLVDASGTRLEHGAGPSLPREYQQAIHGAPFGPEIGPCAMAASLKEQVISADLATESRWERWCTLALSHGLRSCWSAPILSSANRPLGAFATYQRQPSSPSAAHQAIVERFTHLAAVAIERSRAEGVLRESEARFRTLTELSSDWYWTQDENLRFTDFSGRGDDWAGFETATSIGKARWEIEGASPVSSSWAEHQATLDARQAFRDFEYMREGKSGEIFYATVSGTPVFDERGQFVGYQGVTTDITERKRIEEELRSRSEMLELAQKAAGAVAWQWTSADSSLQWTPTPAVDALFGLQSGGYDGTIKFWSRMVHPEDWPHVKATMVQAAQSGDIDFEYRIVRPDGGVRWLHAKGRTVVDVGGKPARSVGFLIDATERHRAEDDLHKMEQELRRAQRLEALGTLAGGIAHDFNNILGAILGYGEMALRNTRQGTRLHRDVDAIMAAGERGRALIDRILAFSRSGVGERVPVHVEAVVHEALDQVAANLPDNVAIRPLLRAGRAAMLGDSTQVHQVVMNLATNAVQAMPQGGLLRITLQTAQLETARPATVGSLVPGEYIVLEVADTGTGIPNDVLERMFDPFFTTKEVGVGSGLGLSLVHGIVTSAGGAVDVDTRPGEGSSFTVYLRRCGDAPEMQADEDRPLPRGEGQRVLVVDDEEPLVRLATETLEGLGYAPISFTSSTAALAAFRADPARFDAVLTDERMPELSGSALIREVRGIRGAIPVVLMSGYLGIENVDADVVVKKPVSTHDLAASMARALRPPVSLD